MPAALIVIDVQQSFLHRPYWSDEDLPAFRAALIRLVAGCRARAVPVVHVLHEDGKWPFDAASGLVRPLDWLLAEADATFIKQVHNALTGSCLADWLAARDIDSLLIAGIRTEQGGSREIKIGNSLKFRKRNSNGSKLLDDETDNWNDSYRYDNGIEENKDVVQSSILVALIDKFSNLTTTTNTYQSFETTLETKWYQRNVNEYYCVNFIISNRKQWLNIEHIMNLLFH